MNQKRIVDSMMKVLEENEHYPSVFAIGRIYDVALENKKSLIGMMSQHKGWQEDTLRCVISGTFAREINEEEYRKGLSELGLLLKETLGRYLSSEKGEGNYIDCLGFLCFLKPTQKIDYKTASKLNGFVPELKAKEGMKLSRAIRKFFSIVCPEMLKLKDEWGKNKFDKIYAPLSDVLNPVAFEKPVVFSVNPIDFLQMSHGNSWESCHNIYDGCYMGGTLSYMLDSSTVIVYTVNESDVSNLDNCHRINRQVVHWNEVERVLLQSRLYPQCNDSDTELYKQFREMEEKFFADCLKTENLWKYVREHNMDFFESAEDSNHYPDYVHFPNQTGICILKDAKVGYEREEEEIVKATIGHVGIDIETGEDMPDIDSKALAVSEDDEACYCSDCGRRILRDEEVRYGWEVFCTDCCFYDNWAEEWYPDRYERRYEVIGRDGCFYREESIDEMLDEEDIYKCDYCGDYVDANTAHKAINRYYTMTYCCEDCCERNSVYSQHEKGYIYETFARWIDSEEDYYPKDSNEIFECEECDECFLVEEQNVVDGRCLCNACAKDARTSDEGENHSSEDVA